MKGFSILGVIFIVLLFAISCGSSMATTDVGKSVSFDPPYYIRGVIWFDHDNDGSYEPGSPDYDHYVVNYPFQYHRSDEGSTVWHWVYTTDIGGEYEIEIDDDDVEVTIRFPWYQNDFNYLVYNSMEQGISTWMGYPDTLVEYCGVFSPNMHHSANFRAIQN